MTREEYRTIKGFSKDQMEKWLNYDRHTFYNNLRKEFEHNYQEELDNSIENFITAMAYTLHYSEDVSLQPEQLSSFMSDLFVTVDMFRSGEYKPDEYIDILKEDGIIIADYDYDKLYREKSSVYQKRCEAITELIKNDNIDVEQFKTILNIKEEEPQKEDD